MRNLIANRTQTGYTSTLTTLALKYLTEAEQLYGPKTADYTYGGVEFIPDGPPRVWFPYGKFVVVQLTQSTLTFLPQGIFQLSHEVIHVISPNGKSTTNNLEEGLATYFSKFVTDRDSGDKTYSDRALIGSKYLKPFELVKSLLELNPNAIKDLRKVQPILGEVTKDDFAKAQIDVPQELVEELLKPMEY